MAENIKEAKINDQERTQIGSNVEAKIRELESRLEESNKKYEDLSKKFDKLVWLYNSVLTKFLENN